MLDVAANQTAPVTGTDGVLLRVGTVAVLLLLAALTVWVLRRSPPGKTEAMTPLEHVEELRRRLLVALAAWLVTSTAAFSFRYTTTASGWPLLVPAVKDNLAAQAFRALSDHLVPDNVTLVVTRPLDAFMAELYLALGIGALVALPVILVQFGRYVGPALRDQEKRVLRNALLPALALFALGIAFAWLYVVPFILETLYGYSTALGAEPLLAVGDLVAFTVALLLTFGLAFQTPLVMHVLARTGLVRARTFLKGWRIAVVAILIFSAIVTDPTIVSQLLVAAPLIALYFLGIAAARYGERRAHEAAS